MSAPVTAAAMRGHLRDDEVEWVWRMLLQGRDHLTAIIQERDEVLLGAWEAEPGTVGSAEWDALFAAIVAHEVEGSGLDAPAWTLRQPLPDPWMPEHPFLSPDRVRDHTPHWLRRQNIFIPARDLVTA